MKYSNSLYAAYTRTVDGGDWANDGSNIAAAMCCTQQEVCRDRRDGRCT